MLIVKNRKHKKKRIHPTTFCSLFFYNCKLSDVFKIKYLVKLLVIDILS